MQGLYFWYSDPNKPVALFSQEITPKGDCFQIVNGYAFLTWYKGGMQDRSLMLSRLKLGTTNWVTVQFPYKNTLYTVPYQGVDYSKSPGGDSHRTAAVGVSAKDGTIHMIFDQHTGDLNYVSSMKNIAFAPDADFKLANFNAKRDYLVQGKNIPSCTYPGFITNDGGELVLYYRYGTQGSGNMVTAYYDGNIWSSINTIVEGRSANPTYNMYGGLTYQNGKMHLCGTQRVKDAVTNLNQGIYFGDMGQRGIEPIKSLNGNTYNLPIINPQPLKILEPLSKPTDNMGTEPTCLITESGAMHFSAYVTGQGTYHFYKKAGDANFTKSSNTPRVNFSSGNKVYSTSLNNGKVQLQSTLEAQNAWKNEILVTAGPRLAVSVSQYYQGKLYVVSAADVQSDKRDFYFTVIDLGLGTVEPTCSINPHVNVNNSGWSTESTVKVELGSSVVFGHQSSTTNASDPNNWSWTGPNNYSSNTRQITLNNIQEVNAGEYTVSYTDSKGCKSTYSMIIDLPEVCTITNQVKINDQWTRTNNIKVNVGDTVKFGPQSNTTGADDVSGWSWTGPGNFIFNDRSFLLDNIDKSSAGVYKVTFISPTDCIVTSEFTVSVSLITSLHADEGSGSKTIIYPNPSVTGVFELSNGSNWKVFSVLGEELKSGNSNQINLSEYPKGIYLIKTNDKMQRVVIE